MDFLPVFIKMIELFLIIILGYIANKVGVFGSEAKHHLSKLILNLTMPCLILSAVLNAETLPGVSQIGILLLVSFSNYVILFVIAKVSAKLLRLEGQKKAVVEFGLMFANVGFIGYPVTQAIFGADSLFYTTIFNLPFNIICYSLGVDFIVKGNMEEAKRNKLKKIKQGDFDAERGKSLSELLLSPALIASAIALILALIGFDGSRLSVLASTTEMVGNITTPGALLIIGSSLAEMEFKEMWSNGKAYIVTLLCVVVTPLIMYLIYSPFIGNDTLLIGETVVISGMPVATAGTMLCVEYNGDEKFMAQITFLSTLASIVTIPLLTMIL